MQGVNEVSTSTSTQNTQKATASRNGPAPSVKDLGAQQSLKMRLQGKYGGSEKATFRSKLQKESVEAFKVDSYQKGELEKAEKKEAFNKLELPLVIVGEGEEEKNLKAIAEKNISFLGFQPEAELQKIYAKVRAFVFAAEEDFGMAAVEAMQQGVPVLTLRKGGALETVIEGKTGEFFEAVSPEVIADTVRKFVENEEKYNKEIIQKRAGEFSKERFMRELREYINKI
jgi:glycogen synthase